jgi:hypothetical protein
MLSSISLRVCLYDIGNLIVTATEYIHQLEEKNARLAREKAIIQVRIAAFEKVHMKMRARRSVD